MNVGGQQMIVQQAVPQPQQQQQQQQAQAQVVRAAGGQVFQVKPFYILNRLLD
jgi:hypothetical protein